MISLLKLAVLAMTGCYESRRNGRITKDLSPRMA